MYFFFIEIVGPIMNLINETHNFYERREYTFNVILKYNIITQKIGCLLCGRHHISHHELFHFKTIFKILKRVIQFIY